MYKVFVNDRPLFIGTMKEGNLLNTVTGQMVSNFSEKQMEEALSSLEKNILDAGIIISSHPEKTWKKFSGYFRLIEAAGGVVTNPKGEMLFIFRNGKWDLPKGKLERKEPVEKGALREVEEECGIHGVELGKKLPSSWHMYRTDKQAVLKHTTWFRMIYAGNKTPVPQTEEGITKIQFFPEKEKDIPLGNTYGSIRDVVSSVWKL